MSPLISMSHSRKLKNPTNSTYEHALGIVYSDYSFEFNFMKKISKFRSTTNDIHKFELIQTINI